MSVTKRVLPSGTVTWRAKVFFEGRVIAQRSFSRRVDAKRWEEWTARPANIHEGAYTDAVRNSLS